MSGPAMTEQGLLIQAVVAHGHSIVRLAEAIERLAAATEGATAQAKAGIDAATKLGGLPPKRPGVVPYGEKGSDRPATDRPRLSVDEAKQRMQDLVLEMCGGDPDAVRQWWIEFTTDPSGKYRPYEGPDNFKEKQTWFYLRKVEDAHAVWRKNEPAPDSGVPF